MKNTNKQTEKNIKNIKNINFDKLLIGTKATTYSSLHKLITTWIINDSHINYPKI